jgi:hypothetical protein
VRPIAIICVFRKIFERLLLSRLQYEGWARLHPAQAGFRRDYSTVAYAAVVHQRVATGRCRVALFLDF